MNSRWLLSGLDRFDSAVLDLDLARLQFLRNLADQVHMEKAVLHARADHLYLRIQLEAALECPLGDSAVKDFAAFLFAAAVLARTGNGQLAIAGLDGNLVLVESRDSKRDPVRIFPVFSMLYGG